MELIAVLVSALPGCVVKASWVATDGATMENVALVAAVSPAPMPDAVAVSCLPAPAVLMLRLEKVALPDASVFCVSVPLNVPLPAVSASVTGTPLEVADAPPAFWIWTTTGDIVALGAALAG